MGVNFNVLRKKTIEILPGYYNFNEQESQLIDLGFSIQR